MARNNGMFLKVAKGFILNYFLIILVFTADIILIILKAFDINSTWITAVAMITLTLIGLKEIFNVYEQNKTKKQQKIDSATIKEIDDKLSIKLLYLEKKEKLIKEFIKEGVVRNDDLVDNLNKEQFIILYHFNRALNTDLEPLFKIHNKKAIYDFLDEVGFIPVGAGPGRHFFHVISTQAITPPLDDIACLESYLKEKMTQKWEEIWENIKINHPTVYNKYQNNKDKKANLSYFLGKIMPSNLSIGWLNLNAFDIQFANYYSRFVDIKKLKVDKQKLAKIINLASIEFFIRELEPKSRDLILSKENDIKNCLGIKTLFDYGKIKEQTWDETFRTILKINNNESKDFANKIRISTNEYLPIIQEFV